MKKQHVKLSPADHQYLASLLAKGKLTARAFKRATGLLELDRGKTLTAVAATLGVDYNTVAAWRDNYKKQGVKCLEDAPRSGRPIVIDGKQRAKITALACSEAPKGHAKWSLRLLAEKVVESGYCEEISHTQVGKILEKNELKPHLKQTWCIGTINAEFIARLEDILWLYGRPYDPQYPVICFDERPCFLIGDLIEPLALQSGRVRKEHYAYEKHGSCALLAAIEPLTGNRFGQVRPQRTKREYALFLKELSALYPEAVKIRLVQDNLSTHTASAFYENLPAAEAFALARRFEFHYTPKSASWLNMIECEFSALARQCLDRRIPKIEQLEKEVLALVKERCEKKIKINWQFSIGAARNKLNKYYQRVFADNSQYKQT